MGSRDWFRADDDDVQGIAAFFGSPRGLIVSLVGAAIFAGALIVTGAGF